ncbi:MAG: hypothetical protein WKH64_16360 [Chloroflexia bacterium]
MPQGRRQDPCGGGHLRRRLTNNDYNNATRTPHTRLIAAFQEQGYLVVRGLFEPDEVDGCSTTLWKCTAAIPGGLARAPDEAATC